MLLPCSYSPAEAHLPTICHVTTAHRVSDVRIYERECRSLSLLPDTKVILIGWGALPSGSRVAHLALPPPPVGRVRRFLAAPRRGWRSAAGVDADVYHFHDPELIPVALRLARRGHRVIWDAHEDYQEQFRTGAGKEWLPVWARSAAAVGIGVLLKQMDHSAAGVVAATPTIASRYKNPRTVVVGNEARLEDFSGCAPNFHSTQVLFTGYTGPSHCFEAVVHAVAALPQLTLAVAGGPPVPTEWAQAQAVLGRRLKYLGWLDRAGLAQACSNSVVGAVTYADTQPYAVAQPTKLFEFAACGLPMLMTPNPSITSKPGAARSGVVSSGFTAGALTEALRGLVGSQRLWEERSRSGREFASEQGSWANSEARLVELYGQVLGCPGGPL